MTPPDDYIQSLVHSPIFYQANTTSRCIAYKVLTNNCEAPLVSLCFTSRRDIT